MCGRFTLTIPGQILAEHFHVPELAGLEPRYNITPTQTVPAIRQTPQGRRELARLRWGLVPSWADDPAIGNRLLNARSETVAEKPSFRTALRQRRCLVPADGFYEWQPRGGKKQPWWFRVGAGEPFALAGLWERWQRGGEPLETFTLLTTEANDAVRPVHDRMPVIIPPEGYDAWLDPGLTSPEVLRAFLKPLPAEALTATPVSPRVNSPRLDDPACVAAVALT